MESNPKSNQIKEVKIGSQIWMAKNLNVSHFRNGDMIPEIRTNEEWETAGKNMQPAWCYYDNNPENANLYGKLYNWAAVLDSRGLAPEGWSIPTRDDWSALAEYLGGADKAGKKMKSIDRWGDLPKVIIFGEGKNGNNKSGFSGLPSGERTVDGHFEGFYAKFWFFPPSEPFLDSRVVALDGYDDGFSIGQLAEDGVGHSIRCIKT